MKVQEEISSYIDSQAEAKRADMLVLHQRIQQLMPGCKLWFFDGKDTADKTVTNPTAGYGQYTIKYAKGNTREFFQVGMSGNTTGISIYLMGLDDKKYLPEAYGKTIGKASVTGYCIKFKALKDINMDVLDDAIRYAAAQTTNTLK